MFGGAALETMSAVSPRIVRNPAELFCLVLTTSIGPKMLLVLVLRALLALLALVGRSSANQRLSC